MKETILLTKILFKSSTNNKVNRKNKLGLGKIILFILLYAYLAGIVGYISYQAINSLIPIKQQAVFLNLCFIGILGIGIIQTIFNSLNILFFSKDIERLLPLPINPIKIVMAKLNCLIISQYILMTIIIVPVLVVYGYLLKLNITFYIIGIIVSLLFPIVPVILTSILITIIMKCTNIIKNKDMVQYISVAITLILVIVIQFINTLRNNNITNEELVQMLVKTNGLVELYSKYFITIEPTINSILNYNNLSSILNIGILFIESMVIYVVGSIIISKIYIKTVTTLSSGTNKKISKIDENRDYKQKTVLKSYVKKEFINLTRNPIFFMQCVLPSILFPIIFSIPIWISFKDLEPEKILEFKNLVIQNTETPLGLIVCLAIISSIFMFNFIALTSISRDRNNANFMKYIPINLEKQCLYKIMPGILLNIIPVVYLIVLIKIIIPIVNIKILIYTFITSMLINIFNNYSMIIIDLKNPKLEWITEYAVVKQNINMFFQIVIILIETGIIFLIGINISNLDILMVIISISYIISIYLIKRYINKNQNKIFNKIV